MSVDHDFDPIELPQAGPSEAAREQAIFKAVTQFEEVQRRQGRAVPVARRLSLGALLPRPGLRMALATGAALLIAVPMGVETMKSFRPTEAVQQASPAQTDQAKLAGSQSPPPAPVEAQKQITEVQTTVQPTAVVEPSRDAAANAPGPAQPHPVVPAAQIAPLPEPASAPSVPIAALPQTVAQPAPSSSVSYPSRLAPQKPASTGKSLGGSSFVGGVPLDLSTPVGGQSAPTGSPTAPAVNGDSRQFAYSTQLGGGINASISIEDGRSASAKVAVGGKTGTADKPAKGNYPKAPTATPQAMTVTGVATGSRAQGQTVPLAQGRLKTDAAGLGGDVVRGFAPGGIGPRDLAGGQQAQPSPDMTVADEAAPLPPPNAGDDASASPRAEVGRDKFANAPENAFKAVAQEPVSTFSIDVDTASYSYVRAALNQNVLPQPDSVRIEELINYFPYDYAPPKSAEEPFSTAVTVMPNPWLSGHKLMRIGIKGFALPAEQRPPANLVFLIDTSGSMDEPNKLPLLIKSLGMLVDTLRPQDRVSIVAYAGSAGVVLPPTTASHKARIEAALGRLQAGGSTAGGEGIRLAYQLAEANFDAKAVNRVMLSTDGDFNVGITDPDELKGFVERERGKGIFLSVLGFGMGNLNDAMMQELAQNGNGAAAYIDTLNEARKVLVDQATSTLFPIAKDVKIQVEFNPAAVSDYRLIGYETRMLKTEDFNNDKVDAGDVGSGASVTALYDFVPAGGARPVDASRYQPQAVAAADKSDEYAFLKIRYKLPKSDQSTLMTTPVTGEEEARTLAQAPLDARFAVAVAGFGEWLRGGRYSGSLRPDDIIALAMGAKGEDPFGYRAEFVNLVRAAKTAKGLPPSPE